MNALAFNTLFSLGWCMGLLSLLCAACRMHGAAIAGGMAAALMLLWVYRVGTRRDCDGEA